MRFPADFTWGAATAAFQIEGAAQEDGRTDSIWDAYCRAPGAVVDGDTGDVACDHYHRMPDDVALLADLGFRAYRFSTSWARVCPDGALPNAAGLDFYSRLVDELLAARIEPWLTLYHWDLPQALQEEGGWTNRATAERFADYAEATYRALGGRVRNWTTLNEPWCSTFLSYAGGEHAPGHTDPREAAAAVHVILLAHGLACQRLRAVADEMGWELNLGITLNFSAPIPADPDDDGCLEAARRIDGATARVFLDPLFKGCYPDDVLDDMAEAGLGENIQEGDLEIIGERLDFLGVNFYNAVAVAPPADGGPWGGSHPDDGLPYPGPGGRPRRSPWVGSERVQVVDRGLPKTAMGWEVHGPDIGRLLVDLHEGWTGEVGIPLYVTENGAAYDDQPDADGFVDDSSDRGAYYRQHLAAVADAIERGADVRGYFAWSLMDNFEWAFGYSRRFGIVRVDYETQRRTPKWSARWFGRVIEAGELVD